MTPKPDIFTPDNEDPVSSFLELDRRILAIKPGVPYLPNSKEDILSDPDWRAWLEKI